MKLLVRYNWMNSLSMIALPLLALAIISCDRDKNNPGYDYFPDMAYSRAYETYAPNPNFPDGKTLQTPVEGTVSREAENYPYLKNDTDLLKAAKMRNPFVPDTEIISRGKIVYANVCMQCHGEKADGKGHLYVSGKYPYQPANLISQKIIKRTDGEIYHIITVGFGVMAPHGIIVQPADRWKVVLYLRTLQK
jgi:mono/diheme cytochrome c family protein